MTTTPPEKPVETPDILPNPTAEMLSNVPKPITVAGGQAPAQTPTPAAASTPKPIRIATPAPVTVTNNLSTSVSSPGTGTQPISAPKPIAIITSGGMPTINILNPTGTMPTTPGAQSAISAPKPIRISQAAPPAQIQPPKPTITKSPFGQSATGEIVAFCVGCGYKMNSADTHEMVKTKLCPMKCGHPCFRVNQPGMFDKWVKEYQAIQDRYQK